MKKPLMRTGLATPGRQIGQRNDSSAEDHARSLMELDIYFTAMTNRMTDLGKKVKVSGHPVSIVGKRFNHGICSIGDYLVCAQIALRELKRKVQLIMSTQKWLKGSLSVRGRSPVGKKDKEKKIP
jgi:hypothetical protein